MNRKMYWGIAALVVVLIAAGGFIYYQWSEVAQLKEQLAQDNKRLEENNKPVAENKPPRPAREGYKWEWHGDHWHEMPVAQNDAPTLQNPAAEEGISTVPAEEIKPLDFITFEEYEKQVTEAWKNLPRDEWGNPLASLPDTPGEAGRWHSFDEALRAGRLWHKLNEQEAKRVHKAHERMKAYYAEKLRRETDK